MSVTKRIIIPAFIFLLVFSIVSRVFFRDFQNGWEAYQNKDYKTAYEIWLPLAEKGDTRAQFFMGFMHDMGFGVPKDDKEAVNWYRLAAEQGDSRAQLFLGFMYDLGKGVPQDDKEALKWYQLAEEQGYLAKSYIYNLAAKNVNEAIKVMMEDAEKGVVEAQYLLAIKYTYGQGVLPDSKEAAKWYRLASEQGYMAKTYIYHLASKNVPEALKVMMDDAEKGVVEAQINLGLMYEFGQVFPQDYKEAFKWYRLVSEQEYYQPGKNELKLFNREDVEDLDNILVDAKRGVPKAQYNLGLLYASGQGVPKDQKAALNYFKLAVEHGYKAKISIYHLAAKNVPEALKVLMDDAENGIADAQFFLASMYVNGHGVQQDYKEALKWYGRAMEVINTLEKRKDYSFEKENIPQALKRLIKDAENGDAKAQIYLAELYLTGDRVPRDYQKAAKWFQLAAKRGNSEAQYKLGTMYVKGQGVSKNIQKAIIWLRLAVNDKIVPKNIHIYNLAKKFISPAINILKDDAERGSPEAQYYLGMIYDSKKPDESNNRLLAYFWYNLSAFHGHKDALKQVELMKHKMSEVEKGEAQTMVEKWNPKQ